MSHCYITQHFHQRGHHPRSQYIEPIPAKQIQWIKYRRKHVRSGKWKRLDPNWIFKENNIGWVSNRDQLIFKKIPSVVLLLFIRSFIQQKSQRTGKSALKSETMGIYYMNPTREHPINKSVIKVFIPPRVQRNLRLGVYFSYTLQLLQIEIIQRNSGVSL